MMMVYGITSYFWDQWDRHPWEAGGGVNVYPMKSRSWRLNLQVIMFTKALPEEHLVYILQVRPVQPYHRSRYSALKFVIC